MFDNLSIHRHLLSGPDYHDVLDDLLHLLGSCLGRVILDSHPLGSEVDVDLIGSVKSQGATRISLVREG